ncbi:MAG: hypothetical protein ACJ8F7_22525, partial [Gemmataceae bacterium]
MARRRRIWRVLLGILGSGMILLVLAAWPGCTTYTVSPETTGITAPLDKRGFVDYPTALNERLREGVTPENNANVLIWKVLGPRPEGGNGMPPEYFRWLGIEEPPAEGDYWVNWKRYFDANFPRDDHDKWLQAHDLVSDMAKWPWAAKEQPLLAVWLRQNDKQLALVIEATKREQYYNPLVPSRTEEWSASLLSCLLPNVQRCRELAAALLCRAMLRTHEGTIEGALSDLFAVYRLGRLVGRGGTMIEALVGFALEGIANKGTITLLSSGELSAAQLRAFERELNGLPTRTRIADKINLTERFLYLDTVRLIAEQGTPFLESLVKDSPTQAPQHSGFQDRLFTRSINWDPALRNAHRWYDRIVAAGRIGDRPAREEEMNSIRDDIRAFKQDFGPKYAAGVYFGGPTKRGEVIGMLLLGLLLPALDKVQDAQDRYDQWDRNMRVAVALAA